MTGARSQMSGNQRRVLVVEDDAGARWALIELLRSEGFVVAGAKHGAEAFTVLETFEPNVIVSDVEMPEMGGIELCHKVRRTPKAPAIVLMSSRPLPEPEIAAFVSKPIVLETLLDAIEGALASGGRGGARSSCTR